MRWVIVLLLVPLAGAQSELMNDAGGDTETTAAGGTGAPADAPNTGPYDLRAFYVSETPTGFVFSIQVEDLALDGGAFGNGVVHVQFQHADRAFRVSWYRQEDTSVRYYGELGAYDGGRGGWSTIDRGPVEIEAGASTLRFTALREALVDSNGTTPQLGRALEGFVAFSRGSSTPFRAEGGVMEVSDRMPDDGAGPTYEVLQGLAQTGHARLASSAPVRASNGEKATFVFHVEASNLRADEDRFALSAKEVPAEWEITLPAAAIRLDGNTTRSFPVLASVPFRHQHGALEDFVLEMKSQTDPGSVGRLQMGIRYLAIPQPAGHHDSVWIHARTDSEAYFDPFRGANVVAYMNTLEEDELDEGLPVPPSGGGGFVGQASWRWDIYLEPGLEMGLDFDRNRTGELEVRIGSELAWSNAELRGRLVHLRGEPSPSGSLRSAQETVLADIVPSSPSSLGTDTGFNVVLQPTPDSDFVPFSEHVAMRLELVLSAEGGSSITQTGTPHLFEGRMRLPLNEYRDPVENVLNALAGLSFRHESLAERSVNSGETVLFNLTLRNDGAVDDVFALRVNGTNADWARILGDTKIFVPTGSERLVVVAVTPPSDAPQADVADLIVTAASQAEPTVQGNIRVLATVDDLLDHPDESHLVQDVDKSLRRGKASPGPLVLLPVLAVGHLLRARRK